MNSPVCDKCDCVKGCQSNPSPCPILLAECIASGQVSAAQIEQHRVLDAAIAQPEQPAPVRQPLTDQDAKDAARYRFLKAEAYECVVPHGQKINGSREGWITKIHPGKDFDSSIDEAIRQGGAP